MIKKDETNIKSSTPIIIIKICRGEKTFSKKSNLGCVGYFTKIKFPSSKFPKCATSQRLS